VLDRSEAYMGVMVDDLITRGVTEPYRMFTSRAEYRLLLREDNAADRLLAKGHALGLISAELNSELQERRCLQEELSRGLDSAKVFPSGEVNEFIRARGGQEIHEPVTGTRLLKRPEISATDLAELGMLPNDLDPEIARRLETEIKYEGYIERQRREAHRFKQMEQVRIPDDLDYDAVHGLSAELRERLKAVRPASLGQVSRIPGITPAAVSALMISLRSKTRKTGSPGQSPSTIQERAKRET
jgi:tRNA uridine 5-carboxymethylaminomethyl modification enzyme